MPYLRQGLCILFLERVEMASFRRVVVLDQAGLEIYAKIGYGVDVVTIWNTDTNSRKVLSMSESVKEHLNVALGNKGERL